MNGRIHELLNRNLQEVFGEGDHFVFVIFGIATIAASISNLTDKPGATQAGQPAIVEQTIE